MGNARGDRWRFAPGDGWKTDRGDRRRNDRGDRWRGRIGRRGNLRCRSQIERIVLNLSGRAKPALNLIQGRDPNPQNHFTRSGRAKTRPETSNTPHPSGRAKSRPETPNSPHLSGRAKTRPKPSNTPHPSGRAKSRPESHFTRTAFVPLPPKFVPKTLKFVPETAKFVPITPKFVPHSYFGGLSTSRVMITHLPRISKSLLDNALQFHAHVWHTG